MAPDRNPVEAYLVSVGESVALLRPKRGQEVSEDRRRQEDGLREVALVLLSAAVDRVDHHPANTQRQRVVGGAHSPPLVIVTAIASRSRNSFGCAASCG